MCSKQHGVPIASKHHCNYSVDSHQRQFLFLKSLLLLLSFNTTFSQLYSTSRLDIDLTIRHTLWSQTIGGTFYWLQANAVSQNMIQRYLALPTLRAARIALCIFIGGITVLMLLCSYNGLLIYASYKECDPLTTKLASQRDQLLPLFVMDTLGGIPGLSGLFVAGVFSAALSSLSTCN